MNIKMNVNVPDQLKSKIIQFALNPETRKYFQNNSEQGNRRFCSLNKVTTELSEEVASFAKRAYEQIGVSDFIEEHLFGNFIGVNENGGNVHAHMDPRHDNGYYHIRLNFLLQKPLVGGNPVINNVEYQIQEDDSWINYASEWWHASTPVSGGRERIVLSLGAYIHPDVVQRITDKINQGESIGYDYARVLRPQEDYYDIFVMNNLKLDKGYKKYNYPKFLMKFDEKICIVPYNDSLVETEKTLRIDYSNFESSWRNSWSLGYENITNLVDILAPSFGAYYGDNHSGHLDNSKYGYPNVWGVMATFDAGPPSVAFTNVFHELMHWKLIGLGFGSEAGEFMKTTKDFILNDRSELCWSIVNSYDDTAQENVGSRATDRPISASLHAYVSFLGVSYAYVQCLKTNPDDPNAITKVKLWGSRFDKSFEELLKVGKFTPKGEQLMRGLATWTADFYREASELKL